MLFIAIWVLFLNLASSVKLKKKGKFPDKYKNKFYKMQRENIKMPHNSMNMLTWGLPIIKREVSKRGVDIFNCNEQSEWVKNNSMRFAKIVT